MPPRSVHDSDASGGRERLQAGWRTAIVAGDGVCTEHAASLKGLGAGGEMAPTPESRPSVLPIHA